MRNGVYPYEYMDTWDRFTEPKLLPKEAFYSKLSNVHISDDDYTHAQKVWATFGCKTLGDYRDDQIFIEGTCPGQVTYKNPFVLMNFELVR